MQSWVTILILYVQIHCKTRLAMAQWKESWEGDWQQDGKYGNISHYFSFSIDVIENDGKRIIRGEGKDGQKSFEITGEYDTSNPTIEFLMTYLPLYKNKFVK